MMPPIFVVLQQYAHHNAECCAESFAYIVHLPSNGIANLKKMAVAERREAEPTTERRNEVGLAVRQATIELFAESGRQ